MAKLSKAYWPKIRDFNNEAIQNQFYSQIDKFLELFFVIRIRVIIANLGFVETILSFGIISTFNQKTFNLNF